MLQESIRRAGNIAAGLQQYAGAGDDAEQLYASKVFAERQRIALALRKALPEGA